MYSPGSRIIISFLYIFIQIQRGAKVMQAYDSFANPDIYI